LDGGIKYWFDGTMNTMGSRTTIPMDSFYWKYAGELHKKHQITPDWQTFKLPVQDTKMRWSLSSTKSPGRVKQMDFSDAGFWLGTAERVDSTGGTIELRCEGSAIFMKNTRGAFRWSDRIDSNANKNDPWWFQTLEKVNEAAEWLTGADFPFVIDWNDGREEIRGK